MRFIPYILYLLLIAFFRTNLVALFTFGSAQIYLTALVVLLVALHQDDLTSLWFGFAAGLIYDAPDPEFMGASMIILSLLGVVTSIIKRRFNLDSLKGRVLLVVVGLLVYSIPYTIIYVSTGIGEFFESLVKGSFLSIIYTGLVGWIFFMFHSGHLSYKKIKSIF